MPDRMPRPGEQHPPEWREDLNPDPHAGQNYGRQGLYDDDKAVTAFDVKALHRRLRSYHDDELKQVPIVPLNTRLEQGATYIDLASGRPREFTATGEMVANRDHCYVLKSAVDYALWNQLIGVENPERTGTRR